MKVLSEGRPGHVLMGDPACMGKCSSHGQDLAPQEVDGDAHSALASLLCFLHGPLPLLELRPLLLSSACCSSNLLRHRAIAVWVAWKAQTNWKAGLASVLLCDTAGLWM